ncbi:kyphoscoliosis peptidase [Patella vulgata]|uniref:kyphoscoliosis peptidase n=1 Tax=Patella vulgata TaxID=6465 RepID=UPI0024A7C114|nr:kyphoscoliosis peptidase [Patella vulgata]
MGCSDSRLDDSRDFPDKSSEAPPANHPVIFTNNTEPTPPKTLRKDIIPSLREFAEIDEHAKSVPSSVRLSPPTLVQYLVGPCTRDLDVIRVFYVWICTNINYDVDSYFGKRMPRNDPQSVLDSKLAVCQGYSELFALFCRIAKLPNRILTGHSKGFAYNPERPLTPDTVTNHAWNVVFGQGSWRFIECTWGAGRMTKEGKFEKKYTDRHFMMDPDKMINDHFPMLERGEEPSAPWQLLREPITLEEFSERTKFYEAGIDWGLDVHPHRNYKHETSDEVEIKLRTTVVPLCDVGGKLYDRKGKECNNYLMVQRLANHVFKVTVRPPESEKYTLSLFGRISPKEDGPYANLVDFMVQGNDIEGKVDPYPDQFGAWGVDDPTKYGLDESMKYNTLYVSYNGRVSLPVRTTGDATFTYKLSHAEKYIEDAEDYVIREFQKNLMVLHMRFPYKGFYIIKLYSKTEPDQKVFDHAANLLIECQQPADIGAFPKTFGETTKQACILLEPGERDLPTDTPITFTIESPLLKCAMVKSAAGSKSMAPAGKYEWTTTITTPVEPDEKIGIYGSPIPNKYMSLFQFKTVAPEPPARRARIEDTSEIKTPPQPPPSSKSTEKSSKEYNEFPDFPSGPSRNSRVTTTTTSAI